MPDLVQYKGIFRVPSSGREESEGEDGTVQLSRWAMGEGDGRRKCLSGILRTVLPYSKLFAQRIGAASKRDLPAQTPGLWASGFGFGSGDLQSPPSPPSTLYPLAVSFSIDYCALLQLLSAAKSE